MVAWPNTNGATDGAYFEDMKMAKIRLTKQQREALKRYNYALKQEDRYLGSVFVTPIGQREIEAKTRAAFEDCKRLGMTWEHGL